MPEHAALVSVVLATYAGDDPTLLAEAIDSVIASGHRPLELLVVADGPLTPAGDAVVAAARRRADWVRLIARPGPRGPAAARNAGLAEARGAFVAILDADDTMSPDRLATQAAFLVDHGLDAAASWLQVIDRDGHERGVREYPVTAGQVRARAAFACPTANPAMMLCAGLLPRFRYPEHLRVGEDYRLWVQLLREGVRIGNVPQPLTRYRTGSTFHARRRGWAYASSDLATKLRALPLAPWWQWPLVVVVAGVTFLVRLLPRRLFAGSYAIFDAVARGRSRPAEVAG